MSVLKKSLLRALVIGLLLVVGWELYWRAEGRVPNIDDNNDLWSNEFSKIDPTLKDQIVFIGSSRILFDTQKPVWRTQTKTDPILLAVQGATPLPVLRYLLEETSYRGLIVVGVAPDLFFGSDTEEHWSWKRSQKQIDYFNDRTYAQRLNHQLSIPLQKNLAFYRDSSEEWSDDVDLGTLLKNARSGERAGPLYPPFYNFEIAALDRNIEMNEKVIKNSFLANSVIKAWGLDGWEAEIENSDGYKKMIEEIERKRQVTTDLFISMANRYKSEGGSLVLVRCPSAGKYRKLEQRDFPREIFWDSLVFKSGLPSVHFEDYPQLQGLNLPELSHLSKEDADLFTVELVKILKAKEILTKNQ